MKHIYSFKITNDTFDQISPIEITECNEILNGVNYFSHSTFLADVAATFTKYEYMGIDFVPKIAVCLTESSIHKFNPNDKESTLESLISFLKLVKIPKCGVSISFFKYEQSSLSKNVVLNSRNFQYLWGFKESWIGDGDFIAVANFRGKHCLKKQDLSFVEELGLKIKYIEYGQTVEEKHDILRHAKCLVTQRGNAVYFASMMQTPIMLVVDELDIDLSLPIKDSVGGILFQNTLVGMDPAVTKNVTHLTNGQHDKFVFTYPECDNVKLLEDIISNNKNMQQNFIKQIRSHKQVYLSRYDNLKSKFEKIVDESMESK